MNIQVWSPWILTGLIFLLLKRLSGEFSSITVRGINSLTSAFFRVLLSQLYVTTGKTITLIIQTCCHSNVFAFSKLSRCVITFLPRSNHLLISQLQSLSAVISEPKKRKTVTTYPFSSSICHAVMEEPGRLRSMGLLRVGHDWVTSLLLFTFTYRRRKWQPTPVFLPGESQGWGSLVGCHLWGCTESDTSEVTYQQQQWG